MRLFARLVGRPIRKLSAREEGNVIILFGLAIPVLLGVVAFSVDAASINHQKGWMQNTADELSLAVAKELHLYGDKPDELKAAGVARAEAVIKIAGYESRPHTVDLAVDREAGAVDVNFTMVAESFIPGEIWSENPISVSSTAIAYGNMKLCVLGLNASKSKTIKTDHGAILTSPECAVQSNSADKEGLAVTHGSRIVSEATCSAGGIVGADAISPEAETDCPAIDDPLADRMPPSIGGCDYLDFEVDKGASTISPGIYCGGIKMHNDAAVFAEPGIYIVTDGKLDMGHKTELRGEYVSFYFADDKATFEFRDKGIVELSAPKDGPMAGILFYENPASLKERTFKISSDSARKLLGTIYLPNGVLKIEGKGKVADASAYTVIVANRIEIDEANLVVNADYSASDVPVPKGLGPNSTKIRLSQ